MNVRNELEYRNLPATLYCLAHHIGNCMRNGVAEQIYRLAHFCMAGIHGGFVDTGVYM